jgi:hypothetical protein
MSERHAAPISERGQRVALIFALVAERLKTHYEHGAWLSEAQGASIVAEWLARNSRSLPVDARRLLSRLSDDMAHQMITTLSREAGLYTAHEMNEALDPNYRSELGIALMAECERLLDAVETGN